MAHCSGCAHSTSIDAARLIAGGVGACGEQARDEQAQFLPAQPNSALLGAHQIRKQIVGGLATPPFDHAVDVVLELQPRRHDDGLVLDDVPVEHLEDVIGPLGEHLPVLPRRAEQRADDRNRILPGDVVDHVAPTLRRGTVDQLGDDVVDGSGQAGGRLGGEGLRHQSTLAVMCVAVQIQQPVDDPIPQRTRSDALRGKSEPAWRGEP